MLTPTYIKQTPDFVVNEFYNLEEDVIADMAKRIKRLGEITASTDYQANLLFESQSDKKEVYNELKKELKKYGEDIDEILMKSGQYANALDYELYGSNKTPEFSGFMENITKGIANKAKEDVVKLSETAGFIVDGNFQKLDGYIDRVANRAAFQVASGAFTYDQVARRYIKELGDKGIRVIDFESGQTREMESHIRRIILDSTRQLSNEISMHNAAEFETDLMEVSAHAGARPSHQDWQGQIISLSGKKGYPSLDDIGYGDVDGFGGANCRHSIYPYFEGTERVYNEEVLKEFENRTEYFEGKEYSTYEARQKQRALERGLRASKRRLIGLEELGDKEAYTAEMIRYRRKMGYYKDFSQSVNEVVRMDNMIVYKPKGKKVVTSAAPKPPKTPKPKAPPKIPPKISPEDEIPPWIKRRQEGIVYTPPEVKKPAKKYFSGKDLFDDRKEEFDAWEATLNRGERSAISKYTGSDYRTYNSALRRYDGDYLKANLNKLEKNNVGRLEEALDRYDLKENIITTRVSSGNAFKGGTEMVGEIYTDHGFMSTTPVKGSFGYSRAKMTTFYIEVPSGKGFGAYVEPISSVSGEQEFLLQRGSQLMIKEVRILSSGSKEVICEVIGNVRK